MKRRGPFRTLGMRMQDFGRSLMRHYVPPQSAPVGRSIAPPPPAWQSDTQTPLIWNEPQETLPPPVENLPFDTSPAEVPPAAAPPVSPPPVRQSRPAAPVAQRKTGDAENKIDPRLLAILGAHQEREAQAARVREERHAAAAASELQRQVDESQPGAQPPTRRRNRASFDYVATKALIPPDEEPGFTPPPKTPTETIQTERQPDQPKDDDDAEESRAAETFSPEANPLQSPATASEDSLTDLAVVSSNPVSAAQPSIQRTFEADTAPAQPILEEYSQDGGEIEPSYTAPITPETVTPAPTVSQSESVPGGETIVQRSPKPTLPTAQSVTGRQEASASSATIQPTIQQKLDVPEQPAAESFFDAGFESPSEDSEFSPVVSQPPVESLPQSSVASVGEINKAEPTRPTVRRQIEQTADTFIPEQPTVQQETGEAAATAPGTTAQTNELPIVQRQVEAPQQISNIDDSPTSVEAGIGNQALPAPIAEPSGDIPAQAERLSDAPADSAGVRRQMEVPSASSDDVTGWTEIEPDAEQAEAAPTGLSEPPQTSAERPMIQRQIEATADTLTNESAQPSAEQVTAQRQAEQPVETSTSEPAQSVSEQAIVQRQIEALETVSDIAGGSPVEAGLDNQALPTPISEQGEPSGDIPAQAESLSETPAKHAVVQRQIEVPPAPPDAEQAEAAPTGLSEPPQTPANPPIIQRQVEQPRMAEPIRADVERDVIDEAATTDIEPSPDFPADVEIIHNAPPERSLAQRQIAQPAANEVVGQGEMEASEAVSDLPASKATGQIPTLLELERTADIPAEPSAAAKAPILNKPDTSIQRMAEPSQPVSASETFSEVPGEEPEQEVEQQPDVFEALVAAGMVSAPPGRPGEIRRKAAVPQEPSYDASSDSEEAFAAETESEQPTEQPVNVFEALVEAGMVAAPPEIRQGRAEIARKPAPASSQPMDAPTPSAGRERPASSSNSPDRLPVQYASPPQVVMRAENDDSAPQQGGESNVDVDKLARDVYSTLLKRLRVDKERRG